MSNIVEYIEQKPWESQRLVGLKYEQLQQLLNNAKELHNKKLAEIQKETPRVIKAGGGRKIKLSVSGASHLGNEYLYSAKCQVEISTALF